MTQQTRSTKKVVKKTVKQKQLTPLGRIVVTLFYLWAVATIGALVGYSIIGQGNPLEVFIPQTWIHLMEVLYNSFL